MDLMCENNKWEYFKDPSWFPFMQLGDPACATKMGETEGSRFRRDYKDGIRYVEFEISLRYPGVDLC